MDIRTPHAEDILAFVHLHGVTAMSMVFMFPDITDAATYYFAKVLALLDIPPAERVSVLQRLVGELRVAIHCSTSIVLMFVRWWCVW